MSRAFESMAAGDLITRSDGPSPALAGSAVPPKRDRALDVARGLAIALMVVAHVGPYTYANAIAHVPVWFSAADAFVLLSGVVLGMRAWHRAAKGQFADVPPRMVRRSFTLLKIHYVGVLVVVLAHTWWGVFDCPDVRDVGGWSSMAFALATLRLQPAEYMNILPLYVVFLFLGPVALMAMQRRATWLVVAISAGLWALAQARPHVIPLPAPRFGSVVFSLAAWQWVFSLGLIVGYHRQGALRVLWERHRKTAMALTVVSFSLLFLAAQLERPALGRYGWSMPAGLEWLVEKQTWGPLRAIYSTLLVGVTTLAATALFRRWTLPAAGAPVGLRVLEVLEVFGRRSLRCFILHLPLALASTVVLEFEPPGWTLEIATIVCLVLLYQACRNDVLARYVPN